MRKNVLVIFSLLLLFTLGCKEKNTTNESPLDDFSLLQPHKIKGIQIKLSGDSILYDPRTIQVFDSVAICYDNLGTTGYSAIDLKSGGLLKRFAYAGNSEKEFNLNSVMLTKLPQVNDGFSLFQINPPSRLTRYNVDSLLLSASDTYKPSSYYQFAKGLNFWGPILLNDSTVIGKLRFLKGDQSLYGVFNINSNKLYTGIELPVLKDEKQSHYYDSTYYPWTNAMMGGTLAYRPGSNSEFVYVSSKGSMIQIFKVSSDNKITLIHQKLYSLPSFQVVRQGINSFSTQMLADCRNGYNDVAVTHDKIYTLYNGSLANSSNNKDLLANTLLVYDWTGKPIEHIRLDQPCYSISIDSNSPQYLYGLRSFDSIGIYKYQIR